MYKLLPLIIIFAGCATSAGKGLSNDPDLTIAIGEENVRVGEKTFAIGDAQAIRAGLAGACARGCKSVELRAIPMARYDALLAGYIAGIDSDVRAMQLRIASSKPVPLAVGETGAPSADCPAEVVLGKQALSVFVNGELLPPDTSCEQWDATVCGTGDTDPLKKTQFGALKKIVKDYRPRFQDRTCVYAESEMPAMLIDRLLSTVRETTHHEGTFAFRRDRREGSLPEAVVSQALVDQGDTLTTCYDAVPQDPRPPMEAVVKFLIGPDGTVGRAEVVDRAMTTPEFEQCLLDAFGKLTFPRPEYGGAVTITYPLRFSPRPGLQ